MNILKFQIFRASREDWCRQTPREIYTVKFCLEDAGKMPRSSSRHCQMPEDLRNLLPHTLRCRKIFAIFCQMPFPTRRHLHCHQYFCHSPSLPTLPINNHPKQRQRPSLFLRRCVGRRRCEYFLARPPPPLPQPSRCVEQRRCESFLARRPTLSQPPRCDGQRRCEYFLARPPPPLPQPSRCDGQRRCEYFLARRVPLRHLTLAMSWATSMRVFSRTASTSSLFNSRDVLGNVDCSVTVLPLQYDTTDARILSHGVYFLLIATSLPSSDRSRPTRAFSLDVLLSAYQNSSCLGQW